MPGLTSRDKVELAYLFELNEFRAFKRLVIYLRERAAKLIIQQDMSQPGAAHTVAMLQGQIYALDTIVEHWRKYHKQDVDKAVKEKR